MYQDMEQFFAYVKELGYEGCTLKEYYYEYKKNL